MCKKTRTPTSSTDGIRPNCYDSESRPPCPALNTAAYDGYLPREGKNLSMWKIMKALRECYNVSWVLAVLFTVGPFVILRLGGAGVGEGWIKPKIDLAAHNIFEHNASMTHLDVEEEIAGKEQNGLEVRGRDHLSRLVPPPRAQRSSTRLHSPCSPLHPPEPSISPAISSRSLSLLHPRCQRHPQKHRASSVQAEQCMHHDPSQHTHSLAHGSHTAYCNPLRPAIVAVHAMPILALRSDPIDPL